MKTLSLSFLLGGLLLVLVMFPNGADAQNRPVQECRSNVADALGMNAGNVQAEMGQNGENGNPVVEWEASMSGRRIRGFCETGRNGQVISTQLGFPRGGGGGVFGSGNGGGPFGGNRPGGGGGGGGFGGAVISMNVDTAGRGTFSGMGQTVRITRGWVDTRNGPSVSLSGEGNFKITFFGSVNGSNQEREFSMRITSSDRGNNATGTATIRMNPDRNEVEYIKVDGRVGGSPFNGIFNRS